MLIIGKNLSGLVRHHKICDESLVDQFSIRIQVDHQIRRMEKPTEPPVKVVYEHEIENDKLYSKLEKVSQNIVLSPNDKLLACSKSDFKIPSGYFGLIQTKGTLARLFVSCTCNDGQVEPGYCGRITLEVTNHSNFEIALPVGSDVAQLFLFKCSGDEDGVYRGKYQGATEPTLPIFKR